MTSDPALNPRQARIVERVEQEGFVTIDQLARDFAVSTQTVRREIIRLDELGVITRFHGGAGRGGSGTRLSYEAKQALDTDLKTRIGVAVASEIKPGACIFLDVGTTAEATARALATMQGLRIVTPGGAIARILSEAGGNEVILTGGRIVGQDLSMAGPIALRTVSSYRFDHTIIACSGIDADGAVLDFDTDKIALKQAAMQFASHKMLIADSGKFGRQALIEVARVSDFDLLITDKAPLHESATWSGSVPLCIAAG